MYVACTHIFMDIRMYISTVQCDVAAVCTHGQIKADKHTCVQVLTYVCYTYIHPHSHNSDVHICACTNVALELYVRTVYIRTVLTCATNMYVCTYVRMYMCVCVCQLWLDIICTCTYACVSVRACEVEVKPAPTCPL